jgi:hypothetical protein
MKMPKGTVSVKNFYASNPTVIHGGSVVLKQTDNYLLLYDPNDDIPDNQTGRFWVQIAGSPFERWRQLAEKDLLTILGINQSDACKLDVVVGVVYSRGNPLNGKSFPLSFCAHQ